MEFVQVDAVVAFRTGRLGFAGDDWRLVRNAAIFIPWASRSCRMLHNKLPDVHPTINNDSSNHRTGRSICFCPIHPQKKFRSLNAHWLVREACSKQHVFPCSLIGWDMFWRPRTETNPVPRLTFPPHLKNGSNWSTYVTIGLEYRFSWLAGRVVSIHYSIWGLLPFTFSPGTQSRSPKSKTGDRHSLTLTWNLLHASQNSYSSRKRLDRPNDETAVMSTAGAFRDLVVGQVWKLIEFSHVNTCSEAGEQGEGVHLASQWCRTARLTSSFRFIPMQRSEVT